MTVILVLILVILLILIGCYLYLKNKIENFSLRFLGTKDFFAGIQKQKMELEEAPKTPYGIDSLILPEIVKDFPNLNVNEMKKVAENSILVCLKSIENKKVEPMKNASEILKNQLQSKIEDLKNEPIQISSLKIHKTVINQYHQAESVCTLVFQTALGYIVTKNGEKKKIEDRINTEFIYIYNDKNIKTHESISLKCPNCGAPIPNLGIKTCPYCNVGIIDLATKTWRLNGIYRVS